MYQYTGMNEIFFVKKLHFIQSIERWRPSFRKFVDTTPIKHQIFDFLVGIEDRFTSVEIINSRKQPSRMHLSTDVAVPSQML